MVTARSVSSTSLTTETMMASVSTASIISINMMTSDSASITTATSMMTSDLTASTKSMAATNAIASGAGTITNSISNASPTRSIDFTVSASTTGTSDIMNSVTSIGGINFMTSSSTDVMATSPSIDARQEQNDDDGSDVGGIIAGCVVAFILIIVIVVCLIIFLICYRAKKKEKYTNKSGMTVCIATYHR